ncbi:hypothetical protein HJG54_15715 [Leptolyngbya sp. NK1-12]|uniref:Uncharacterized protein n=1 Tax=Leptolyngbya sp. NK1-12 TaxID=2547451 RepID=A0AA96WMJ1_9CYAN|nr:hypothetical protein [Leptolyngbya sp. NK1-12]WNZ24161.1 hypothetical protein HJG54_15715 [Leptolyngbya sp. NK1-12]
MLLKGMQLAFLGQVSPYLFGNPPLPGDLLATSSGEAVVTRLELLGLELLVWADYGSGIEQPHGRECATCNLKIVLGGPAEMGCASDSNFETKACGWIGWKQTKRERKKRAPWICRQAWLYWEEPGGKKRSRYIPKAKLAEVERSVYELRRPIYETLKLLEKH